VQGGPERFRIPWRPTKRSTVGYGIAEHVDALLRRLPIAMHPSGGLSMSRQTITRDNVVHVLRVMAIQCHTGFAEATGEGTGLVIDDKAIYQMYADGLDDLFYRLDKHYPELRLSVLL
jgi:hypothetical protein